MDIINPERRKLQIKKRSDNMTKDKKSLYLEKALYDYLNEQDKLETAVLKLIDNGTGKREIMQIDNKIKQLRTRLNNLIKTY